MHVIEGGMSTGRRRTGVAKASDRSAKAHAEPPAGLTVAELIAKLQMADPDAPVVIAGQYGGFEDLRGLSQKPLRLNVNGLDGFGAHDMPEDNAPADVVAVVLGG